MRSARRCWETLENKKRNSPLEKRRVLLSLERLCRDGWIGRHDGLPVVVGHNFVFVTCLLEPVVECSLTSLFIRARIQRDLLMSQYLNDVIAVLALDRLADLTDFQAERGILEFLNKGRIHAKPANVSAFLGTTGIC